MVKQDFTIVTGPIRKGATPVHIYNEGLVVLLYDQANEGRIRDADPQVIWGVGADTFADPATQALLASRELLVYGMMGDGGVDLEVVVGSLLTDKELAGGVWYPAEAGYLSLPSGRLCVHSYNTLPMGDNGDDPPDKGAVLEVPAGAYRVTLYRKNWDEMEEKGMMTLDQAQEAGIDVYEHGRVDEVIVLTPAAEPAKDTTNILFHNCLQLSE
jgi:hypothetical protein